MVEQSDLDEELSEALAWKVPALGGRDFQTNLGILEFLALHGPQTIWNTNKLLGRTRVEYPTTFKAVKRLRKWGYLARLKSVKMKKKRGRTPTFGISGRGLFASLASDKVRTQVLEVIEKNGHLDLLVDRHVVEEFATFLWTKKELEEVVSYLFVSAIDTLPFDIESANDEMLIAQFFPILINALPHLTDLLPKDLDALLPRLVHYPKLIQYLTNLVNQQIGKTESALAAYKQAREWLTKTVQKEVKGT